MHAEFNYKVRTYIQANVGALALKHCECQNGRIFPNIPINLIKETSGFFLKKRAKRGRRRQMRKTMRHQETQATPPNTQVKSLHSGDFSVLLNIVQCVAI